MERRLKQHLPILFWITPEFTPAMQRGEVHAPRVDHSKIDWAALLSDLKVFFKPDRHGVEMRIADDTIDQVTIHMKEAGQHPGEIDYKEFGVVLQRVSQEAGGEVVPVRSDLEGLHFLADRDNAPPPIALPLVLVGDLTDAILFFRTMRLLLGVKADEVEHIFQSPDQDRTDDQQGYLPSELMDLFASYFGLPYKKYAMVTFGTDIDPRELQANCIAFRWRHAGLTQ
jgi:hypothetical protein